MEITLNGKQACIIAGAVLLEGIVAIGALYKWSKATLRANEAEVRHWLRGCEVVLKDWQIEDLQKEIAKLKGKS